MTNNFQALALIADNIAKHGYHVYAISGGALPRFVYTIGNLDQFGLELVFAGGAFYSLREVICAIHETTATLMHQMTGVTNRSVTTSSGSFNLCPVHPTWVDELMLGATDYYDGRQVRALQMVPDRDHHTVDTPDMSQPFSSIDAPAWRWLREPWPYPVAEESVAMTNLAALRGEPITEAARWEETDWELFAGPGPDVKQEDVRAVGLGTLLGFDPSLKPITRLAVGKALWRDAKDTPWQQWGE